jgi:uncharacterized membrane protein YbhN (UPF0104 family)
VVVISANFWKSKEFYAWRHFNDCVFSRHFGIHVFFNDFQFLVLLNTPKLCKVLSVIFWFILFQFLKYFSFDQYEHETSKLTNFIGHFNDCVFSRHFGIHVFFNDFQFLVSHVHKFHIFVAVFLISMSHVHVSHHIIYLYTVVPIKFVSLEVSCSYWSKRKYFKNWNNMNQKITERTLQSLGVLSFFNWCTTF